MDNQRNHLRHIMLHCFKKDNANDTADEICTIYGNGAITITTICNLRDLELTILT